MNGQSGEPLRANVDLDARLEGILDVAVSDWELPGAQAAVVFPDGTVWTGAVGRASRRTGEDVTVETRFPIGSITKLFTATAILRLADRGEVSLDDTVARWLPDEPSTDGSRSGSCSGTPVACPDGTSRRASPARA